MRHYFLFLLLSLSFTTLGAQDAISVYPFAYQNRWGIVQANRTLVMSPQLDSIGLFNYAGQASRYAIAINNKYYGLLRADGSWLQKPELDSICHMEYYLKFHHWAIRKGKYGLLITNGKKAKWAAKPKFTEVTRFTGRKVALAAVAIDGRWGVLNGEGQLIAACKYDAVKLLDDYSDYPDYKLTLDGNTTYIDAFGEELPFAEMKEKEERLAMWDDDVVFEDMSVDEDAPVARLSSEVRKNLAGGTDVILYRNQEEIERVSVPKEYQVKESKIDDGYRVQRLRYIMIQKGEKVGFWGLQGAIATPTKYDRIQWQRSGRYGELAFLYQGEKVGLADYRGYQILPAAFSRITEFSYYFKVFHPTGYLGYADETGQVFLPENVSLVD